MADTSPLQDVVARIRAGGAAIAALAPAVEAAAPWPLSDDFGTEPESRWGPPETLAHVAEMLPFWLGQIERVIDGGDGPAPFGRVVTDELRLGVIGRDRELPPRELFARIAADVDRVAGRLAELDTRAAASVGLHPRLGEMSVADIASRFVAAHLEEHAEQLTALVEAPRPV